MQARRIEEKDWEFIPDWFQSQGWDMMPRDCYPGNGLDGMMITKDDKPIACGWTYLSNSAISWIEFILADPEYREEDRDEIIEYTIKSLMDISAAAGRTVGFTVCKHKKLIKKFEKLGWIKDPNPSVELYSKL